MQLSSKISCYLFFRLKFRRGCLLLLLFCPLIKTPNMFLLPSWLTDVGHKSCIWRSWWIISLMSSHAVSVADLATWAGQSYAESPQPKPTDFLWLRLEDCNISLLNELLCTRPARFKYMYRKRTHTVGATVILEKQSGLQSFQSSCFLSSFLPTSSCCYVRNVKSFFQRVLEPCLPASLMNWFAVILSLSSRSRCPHSQ